MLPSSIAVLKGMVKFLPIPFHDGDAEGIKVPYPPAELKRDHFTGCIVYHALMKKSNTIRMPISEDEKLTFRHYGRRRAISYNRDGLLISVVGGFVRNGRVSVRVQRDSFKIRRRLTSRWTDWSLSAGLRKKIDLLVTNQPIRVKADGEVSPQGSGDDWVVISELYSN
jgi:hypothetical protein